MTPEQIITEIWKLPWHQVARIASIDDFILLYKILPAILVIIIITSIFCFIVSISKKRKMQEKIEQCFICQQLFSDPDTFLDEPDTQDIIVITSKIKDGFIFSAHRSCAIDWINTFGGISKDLLNVENSEGLGEILARHLKKKYKDIIGRLQVKVVKRG